MVPFIYSQEALENKRLISNDPTFLSSLYFFLASSTYNNPLDLLMVALLVALDYPALFYLVSGSQIGHPCGLSFPDQILGVA